MNVPANDRARLGLHGGVRRVLAGMGRLDRRRELSGRRPRLAALAAIVALGSTLGERLGATGSGSHRFEDGEGWIDVTFDGLVPEGVHTMWHFFMAAPPTDPFIGPYDLPIGSRDGAESVFTADRDGKARFRRTFSASASRCPRARHDAPAPTP